MDNDQTAQQPDSGSGPYTVLPEPVSPDDLVTSQSTTHPSVEDAGEYDRQEAFLRSYGAG
ncbi:MAG: hypothetical protein H0T54_03035 [Geodermatophilaceae bacterium]|nr:hypothetical protein [Geodermatophilaceae bacterium]